MDESNSVENFLCHSLSTREVGLQAIENLFFPVSTKVGLIRAGCRIFEGGGGPP